LEDYEKFDYRRVWTGKNLEDLSEKRIIREWLRPGQDCLELGGGFGRITKVLEPLFVSVVSLELSKRNLGIAKGRTSKANLSRADIQQIPFRDSSFDCIVMIRVIHLLPDPRAVMSEVLRVARDGATFIVSVPNLAVNNLLWDLKKLATGSASMGAYVWPYGTRRLLLTPSHFASKEFKLESRKGTGLFDNPLGALFGRAPQLHLLDVATSPFWFAKLDVFMKFRVSKGAGPP
jgi:SAM-dependent methyltransferase